MSYSDYPSDIADYSSFDNMMADICNPSSSSSSNRKRQADPAPDNFAKIPAGMATQPLYFPIHYPVNSGWQSFDVNQVYNNHNMNQPGFGWVALPPPMPHNLQIPDQNSYKPRSGLPVPPPMAEFQDVNGIQQNPNEIFKNAPITSAMCTPESDISTSTNLTPDQDSAQLPLTEQELNEEKNFVVNIESPGKLAHYFLPNVESEQEPNEHIPYPYAKSLFPTFGVPVSSDGNVVAEVVDGRLPAVGTRSKYDITVDEIRRRCGAPEHMNQSALYCFFRKSKKREAINRVKQVLTVHNIPMRTMQRQRKVTCFSPFLEEEATALARDLDSISEEFLPINIIAQEMLEKLMSSGNNLDVCHRMLKNTTATITRVIKTLEVRQPKITGQEEKLKGNNLDLSYHNFSLITHGFGHPNSLSHYRSYLSIVERAVLLCEKIQNGQSLLSNEDVIPGQKPFERMSNEYFVEWQMNLYKKKLAKQMEEVEENKSQRGEHQQIHQHQLYQQHHTNTHPPMPLMPPSQMNLCPPITPIPPQNVYYY